MAEDTLDAAQQHDSAPKMDDGSPLISGGVKNAKKKPHKSVRHAEHRDQNVDEAMAWREGEKVPTAKKKKKSKRKKSHHRKSTEEYETIIKPTAS